MLLTAGNALEGLGSLILIIAAIAAVLYLSYLFSRYVAGRSSKLSAAAEYMTVVDRLAVGQDRFLMIVEIAGVYYLMSATQREVRILKELDGFMPKPPPPVGQRGMGESFKAVLRDMMGGRK